MLIKWLIGSLATWNIFRFVQCSHGCFMTVSCRDFCSLSGGPQNPADARREQARLAGTQGWWCRKKVYDMIIPLECLVITCWGGSPRRVSLLQPPQIHGQKKHQVWPPKALDSPPHRLLLVTGRVLTRPCDQLAGTSGRTVGPQADVGGRPKWIRVEGLVSQWSQKSPTGWNKSLRRVKWSVKGLDQQR